MKKLETPLKDLYVIELDRIEDSRGFFCESYNQQKFEKLGFNYTFVQDNHSKSSYGVVRGLHFQTTPGQAKLVRCTRGSVWDVVVDVRPSSPTYKKWFGIELTEENNKMLMVPVGFAHGFATLSETAEFQYKCSAVYNPETEAEFKFDDTEIGVDWKVDNPIISKRDSGAPTFKEIEHKL